MEEDVMSYFKVGALCTVAALGAGLNGFIFFLFYKKRSLRTFSNRCVLSLSASHILQCILIIAQLTLSRKVWTFSDTWSKINDFLTVCLNLASVLSILLIAIDRNCAVNNPLHYNITVTKKRTVLFISIIWLLSIFLSTPTIFGTPQLKYSNMQLRPTPWGKIEISRLIYAAIINVFGFIVPLFAVTCLYFAMFRAAEVNNAKARRNSSNSCLSSDVVVNITPSNRVAANAYILRRNFSSEHTYPKRSYCSFAGKHRAAVTGLLVVISFLICWSPYFIMILYQQFVKIDDNFKFFIYFSSYFSGIINPYIYFFRNKSTWKNSKKIALRMFSRKNNFIPNTVTRSNRLDFSGYMFRLSSSPSQTVLTTQVSMVKSNSNSSIREEAFCKQVDTDQKSIASCNQNAGVFSIEPMKCLMHQDSSTSKDSSEACTFSTIMGSSLSIDEDSNNWYHDYYKRLSEDSTVEISLEKINPN